MTRSPVFIFAMTMGAVALLIAMSPANAQLFSSASRFSSSGLVFPSSSGGQNPNQPGGRQQRPQQQNRPAEEPKKAPQHLAAKADVAEEDSFTPIAHLGNFVRPSPQQQQTPQVRSQQRTDASFERPSQQALTGQALPVRVNNQPREQERLVPPIPLSLIGQQPEEFFSAVQQRQQQQQQQRQQPQAAPVRPLPPRDFLAEEEELLEDEEIQEELQFIPKQQPQRPSQTPRPVRPEPVERTEVRRPQKETQRPEPSIQQPVQQRRPNYPVDYKPSRPQQGNRVDGGNRRPPVEAEPEDLPAEEEEEEEVKPDKLQLLLQKTDFSCADKKDGYYADEMVDCEIFHYCQDRLRHSWLCPEGATFHQVHLICMPVNRDNICKKSSQFHFVNDYLYKTLEDEDGNNDTNTYADRYYPDGYEPGTFDFAEMDDVKQPQRPNFQASNRRQAAAIANQQRQRRPQQPSQYARDRSGSDDNRRRVEPRRPSLPQIASDDEEESIPFNNQPQFRSGQDFDRRDRPQLDISEEVE